VVVSSSSFVLWGSSFTEMSMLDHSNAATTVSTVAVFGVVVVDDVVDGVVVDVVGDNGPNENKLRRWLSSSSSLVVGGGTVGGSAAVISSTK